jgi:hypothetical protein
MKRTLIIFLIGLFGMPAWALPMPEVDARYDLQKGFLGLGTARFSLTPEPELGEDCYRYAYVATPTGMAKLFIGEIRETSEFCMVDDALRVQRYAFSRADRPKGDYTLEFDLDTGVARTGDGRSQTFEGAATDRLSLQLVVQRWVIARNGVPGDTELSVQQVEDDRVRTYRFAITGRETVKVDGRKVETVRVERVDRPDKSVRFWMDPRDGWRVVQVEHIEDGSTQFTMTLRSN